MDIKLEKSTIVALVVLGLFLVLLMFLPKGSRTAGTEQAQPEVSTEGIAVAEGRTNEVESSKLAAYENADRRGHARTGSADALWDTYAEMNGTVPVEQPEEGAVSPVDQVFHLNELMGSAQQPQAAPVQRPRPAPKPKAEEPAPEPVADPVVSEPAPVETVPSQLEIKKSSVIGTVSKRGVVSSLGGTVSDREIDDSDNHLIKCMFIRDQKIKNGERVTVRILEDIIIDGNFIPANSHLTATCSIGGRLELSVSSVAVNGKVLYTNLVGYDNDGLEGLYCPNTQTDIERNALSSGRSVASTGTSAVTRRASSVVGVAIQSGVNAVTGSAGNSQASVFVPSGYKFYLLKSKKQ